jgi:hypothetical protein
MVGGNHDTEALSRVIEQQAAEIRRLRADENVKTIGPTNVRYW